MMATTHFDMLKVYIFVKFFATRHYVPLRVVIVITSAKDVMFCPSFCLSVSNLPKTIDRIFVKILPEMYVWAKKNKLSFGSCPLIDLDIGIF